MRPRPGTLRLPLAGTSCRAGEVYDIGFLEFLGDSGYKGLAVRSVLGNKFVAFKVARIPYGISITMAINAFAEVVEPTCNPNPSKGSTTAASEHDARIEIKLSITLPLVP